MSQRRVEAEVDDDSERSRRDTDRSKASKSRRGGVHSIQRAAGNQALRALHEGSGTRFEPSVSQPGDSAEREAERVSNEVMGMAAQESAAGEETETTTEPDRSSSHVGDGTPAIESLKGSGRPLPSSVKSFFEPRFGRPLGDVRVHTGDRADRLTESFGSKAFTSGRHIAFQSGAYRPEGPSGKHLLAHELTHVLQQTSTPGPPRSGPGRVDEASTEGGEATDSTGLNGDTELAAPSGTGQTGPTIRHQSVPAVQHQTDSSMSTAEAEAFAPHYRDISTVGIENLPTDVLIERARLEARSFEEHSRPALKRASAQVLLAYYEELRVRAETVQRAEDGTLLREGGLEGLVPWTPERPKRVSDIDVFSPEAYLRWTRALTSSGEDQGEAPAMEPRERSTLETPTAESSPEGPTGSSTTKTQTGAVARSSGTTSEQLQSATSAGERTTIGSALAAQEPPSEAPRESVQVESESEIESGLALLQRYTVGHLYEAVQERLTAGSEGASVETAASMQNQNVKLFDTVTELFYLSNRAYLLDRSGHITSGGWKYRFERYSVSPGTVLFEATISIGSDDGGVTSFPIQLSLEEQGVSLSTGAIEFSNPVEKVNEIRPQITAVETESVGLATIVSSNLGSASPKAREWSWGNVRDALYQSVDYLEWAVTQRLRRIQENPSGEAINLAIELGMDAILEAGQKITPVIGQAAAAIEVFEYTNWFFDIAEVAAHAQSGDEIDLAAQAFARRIAHEVITQGQVKMISKAGGSVWSAAGSGDGGGTDAGSTTTELSGETAETGSSPEPTRETAETTEQPTKSEAPPEASETAEQPTAAESTPEARATAERTAETESTSEAVTGAETRTAERSAEGERTRIQQSTGQSQNYETIDDILTPDGNRFHIPDNPRAEARLEMKYQQTVDDTKSQNRWEWAKRQTSGEPRRILIDVIGPDFARKSKLPPGIPGRPTIGDIDVDPLPKSRFTIRTDLLRGAEMDRQREILDAFKRSTGTERTNLGNEYRDLVLQDVHPTTRPELVGKVTERSSPGRRRDLGEYEEITLEGLSGGLTSHKHRQIWIDLFQNGKVKLIAPKLSSKAKMEIRLLAAAAEKHMEGTVSVEIRETIDNL